jgi:glycosyltransferase involved in cell wall biosynthesis
MKTGRESLEATRAHAAPVDALPSARPTTHRPSPRHEGNRPPTRQRLPVRVSAVIPALNEAKNLPHVLTKLPPDLYEVLLVDGNSTDGTASVARRLCPGIRVVQQTRRGKGNALACGFLEASGDVIAMLDADGSTDPAEIPRYVDALVQGAHFAKGSRFLAGGGSEDITGLRSRGNRWLCRLTNVRFGTRYTDLCYGYNAFWRTCVSTLGFESDGVAPTQDESMQWGDGFEIETLINIRAARAGLRVTEVPSFERSRLHGRSNLNAFSDGLRVLRTIAAEGRRRGPRDELATVNVVDFAVSRDDTELDYPRAARGQR